MSGGFHGLVRMAGQGGGRKAAGAAERKAAQRQAREQETVETMIAMYCRGVHGGRGGLCPSCLELVEYSRRRVERCPLIADKPACNKCPVHCYSPEMRERIRQVMRYAGPRMTYRHPVMAWFHLLDTIRH